MDPEVQGPPKSQEETETNGDMDLAMAENCPATDKHASDINSNTKVLCKKDCKETKTDMGVESTTTNTENPSEDLGDVRWKKITSAKQRNYRSRNYDIETLEETSSSDQTSGEVKCDKMEADANGDSMAKCDDELEVEEMENCNITDKNADVEQNADLCKKLPTGKLKRSKCKLQEHAQSSSGRKKRKKGVLSTDKDGDAPESKEATESGDKQDSSEDDSDETESKSKNSSASSSSGLSCDDEKEEENEKVLTDDEVWLEKHTADLRLPTWRAIPETLHREYGFSGKNWQHKVCGSMAMVKRFEQQFTLDAHAGCVNALHFNQMGTLLASGSDDLDIHIWDWTSPSLDPFISYNSGHRSNVFQAKFMPNSNDSTVISCARDGQVRVGYLSSTGSCRDTKKVAQHRGSAHKLALDSAGCRSTFLSCGEDSVVMGFDLRENKSSKKLVSVKEGDSKIALYSIDTNPCRAHEFAVSGRDQWARVYDKRMLNPDNPEVVSRYCPHHLEKASESADMKANITCLVYNYDGSELLCSYNDEDIYLFDTTHSSGDDFKRKYKGHRNNATVKGVNFYGPNSEFVVSGSDCGNIFLWEKTSSKVVQFMEGDDGGVVNVLEPHPNLPLLATSGLDKNIKIWGPTGNGVLDVEKLNALMLSNRRERHEESSSARVIDSHLLWFLMRSLRNVSGRRRQRVPGQEDDDDDDTDSRSSSSNSSSDSDGDEESQGRRMDCLTS